MEARAVLKALGLLQWITQLHSGFTVSQTCNNGGESQNEEVIRKETHPTFGLKFPIRNTEGI